MTDETIINLVPRGHDTDDNGNGTGDVAAWLRTLADKIDNKELGTIGAAVVVLRDDAPGTNGTQFCLRTRRCNMHYVEQAGALQMMHHDMLHS